MAATYEGRPGRLVVGVLLAFLLPPIGLLFAVWQVYRDEAPRRWWTVIAVVAALLSIPSAILITGG